MNSLRNGAKNLVLWFLEIIEGCFPPRLYVHKYSFYLYIYVFGDVLFRAYNNPRGKMGGVDTIIEGRLFGYLHNARELG